MPNAHQIQLPDAASLLLVSPEICLIFAMCAVILVPFIQRRSVQLPVVATVIGLVAALVCCFASMENLWKQVGPSLEAARGQGLFDGMLTVDPFSQFFKILLILFTILIVGQWLILDKRETSVYDVPDFLCLLLGATLGMAMMASASNLLMIFMATESASMPSFILAGFRKKRHQGSEGALKYVIFGAASSAVMLYGMSLIYGSVGSLDLAVVCQRASEGMQPLMAMGLLAMLAGLAFKLSAVPLHFWCPDVFEGAPIPVTTFLSVASKGAAVCLLLRVLYGFTAAGAAGATSFTGLAVGVGVLGAITATWGNLVALHQTNIKRLLAYSSIAHAGYMIMTASTVLLAKPGAPAVDAIGSILFYLFIYLFMNLGAFTVAGMIRAQTGSEDIRDYAGLTRRSPVLMVLMSIFLLSLFGMPGLGGFVGKIYLMKSMVMAAGAPAYALLAVLLLNTLISLYYYLRPVYYMAFAKDSEDRAVLVPDAQGMVVLFFCAAMLLWTGLLPSTPADLARSHAMIQCQTRAIPTAQTPTVTEPDQQVTEARQRDSDSADTTIWSSARATVTD